MTKYAPRRQPKLDRLHDVRVFELNSDLALGRFCSPLNRASNAAVFLGSRIFSPTPYPSADRGAIKKFDIVPEIASCIARNVSTRSSGCARENRLDLVEQWHGKKSASRQYAVGRWQ